VGPTDPIEATHTRQVKKRLNSCFSQPTVSVSQSVSQ